MRLKSNAMLEKKLSLGPKNEMRNWVKFVMRAAANLKIFPLIDYFCRKNVMFELKKYRQIVT